MVTIRSKKTGKEVKRMQQKKAGEERRKGTHTTTGETRKPGYKAVDGKLVAQTGTAKLEAVRKGPPLPSDKLAASKIIGVSPTLAKHLTEYDVKTILGTRSPTIKTEKAREMYTSILKARQKSGKAVTITKPQYAAIKRIEASEQRLQEKLRKTPLLDVKGKEIPRFGAVIKNGEVIGTEIVGKHGARGYYSGGLYYSRTAFRKAQEVNRYANKNITGRTNALDVRRIKSARKTILESLKGQDSVEAVRYFNLLDVAAPVAAFVPTKQATARVTEKLIQAGILALADTKYLEYQKRRIVETKLRRTPVKEDLKADWKNLDTKLSKGLNLPTESEIAAHRDRTFGRIPGFTKWQADFAKKMDTPRYFHGLNLSVEKGFKDFSINEYNRLRNKPATYGAELAAMFIGGEILGAVTKGGTIITKAGLAKAAAMSTRPMVKTGLLKAVKHLDTMVAAGFIAPLVAQGIVASWEDKFKLGKGLLVGGAGFAKGAKLATKATEKISAGIAADIAKAGTETSRIITESTGKPAFPPEIEPIPPKATYPKPAKLKPKGVKPRTGITGAPKAEITPPKPTPRVYEIKEADRIAGEMIKKAMKNEKTILDYILEDVPPGKRPVLSGDFLGEPSKRYSLTEKTRAVKLLQDHSKKYNLGIEISEVRAPPTVKGGLGKLIRYEAAAQDGTVISKNVGIEKVDWKAYKKAQTTKRAPTKGERRKGPSGDFRGEPSKRWKMSERLRMVKELEVYAKKNNLDIKIVESRSWAAPGKSGKLIGYQAQTADGTILSRDIGVEKIKWELYRSRPGPTKRPPTMDYFVGYKGEMFTVPTALKGAKRQMFLKGLYEGKVLDVPKTDFLEGRVSRKQLKEMVPKERIGKKPPSEPLEIKGMSTDSRYKRVLYKGKSIEVPKALEGKKLTNYLNKRVEEINKQGSKIKNMARAFGDLINDESAQLIRSTPKPRQAQIYREVKPVTQNAKAVTRQTKPRSTFSKRKTGNYINNVRVNTRTFEYMRRYKNNPYRALRQSDILALKTGMRSKVKQLKGIKTANKLKTFINSLQLVSIQDALLMLEAVSLWVGVMLKTEVATATALKEEAAQVTAQAIKSKAKAKVPKAKAVRAPGRKPARPTPRPKPADRRTRPKPPKPRKPRPEERIKELPVIPPLPALKRKEQKEKEEKEAIMIANELVRTINNQLGDIKSILG